MRYCHRMQCRGRRGPCFHLEFGENVLEMVADRVGTQSKNDRDLGIAFAFGHPMEDFRFALG